MLKQIWILLLMAGTVWGEEPQRAKPLLPATYRRTVFLGDSITDGNCGLLFRAPS